MKRKVRKLNNQKGMMLISSLIFVLVIATLSTSLFARSISERRQIEMERNRIIAFNLAEAGVDAAIAMLELNAGYTGTASTISLGNGSYASTVTTPDPIGNPLVRNIASTGYAPNAQTTSYAYQERTIATFITVTPRPVFNNAVFTEEDITMKGNTTTDSYDSTSGPYAPGVNQTLNGDLGSNTIALNDVTLEGDASIGGDVTIGPTGIPGDVILITGNAGVSGTQEAARNTTLLDPVAIPESLPDSGDLIIPASTSQALAGGAHLFSEVSIAENGQLTLLGPVELYVTGDVNIVADTVTTPGNNPSNFIIRMSGDNSIVIRGNGSHYGLIYAPEAGRFESGVTLEGGAAGNLDFYGAVVAHKFTGDDTNIHYDESLADGETSSQSETDLVSWTEE